MGNTTYTEICYKLQTVHIYKLNCFTLSKVAQNWNFIKSNTEISHALFCIILYDKCLSHGSVRLVCFLQYEKKDEILLNIWGSFEIKISFVHIVLL